MIHSMFIKMGNCTTQEKDVETVKEDIDSDSESFSSLSPISLIKPIHVREQEQKEHNIREMFTKEYRNQRFSVNKNS